MITLLDFLIPENGVELNPGHKIVCIKVPSLCCGKPTTTIKRETLLKSGIADFIKKGSCKNHLGSWTSVWEHFGPNGKSLHLITKFDLKNWEVISSGCSCVRCNLFNEYAVPNQKNDTYKCFECRG